MTHCKLEVLMPRSTTAPNSSFYLYLVIFLIPLVNGAAGQDRSKIIGVMINSHSRMGKEGRASMEIAIDSFNSESKNINKLLLCVMDSAGQPLQASRAVLAAELLKDKQVVAIVGMETWLETKSVVEVSDKVQVPILSFATPSFTRPLPYARSAFLVKMANDVSLEIKCMASIVGSYKWTKVIAIHEDGYVSDSGILTLLSEELQAAGSYVEHWLTLPQLSTLSDPEPLIQDEMLKLKRMQSRVFVIVGSSLELASTIVTQANHVGIMGTDSVWIATSSVTNLLHSMKSSIFFKMKGLIGIKTHFSDTSQSFIDFDIPFRSHFHSLYPQDEKTEAGFHALRAYDTISAIVSAIEKSSNNHNSTTSGKELLMSILSSNFSGLSGKIRFKESELQSSTSYEIVNVHGKSYSTLKFWSRETGFSDDDIGENSPKTDKVGGTGGGIQQVLGNRVNWPGGLERVPRGWAVPTEAKPLIIGVPAKTAFEFFVKVNEGEEPTGYSIDVFNKARELLPYALPHKFVPFFGSYDSMLDNVYLKQLDAVVGDVTILASRLKTVEFTVAYAESGLSLVVPRKTEGIWLIIKPFTPKLWMVVIVVILYIMFVVWILERRSNPDFRGTWANQLSTALWFTCSTLYFAQRESIRSNFTRVVIFVWLFTVFVITASYTSSLTSMLTVQQLDPREAELTPIGCDSEFIRSYLESVLLFHAKDIVHIEREYDYIDAFENGKIRAAILELPYQRVFLSKYSKDYREAGTILRFAGLGFVFQKGSPLAKDFSEAILKLSEDGTLNTLDKYWFSTYSSGSDSKGQSLDVSNFKELFLITCITATVMPALHIARLHNDFWHHPIISTSGTCKNVWNKIKRFREYASHPQLHHIHKDPVHAINVEVMMPSNLPHQGQLRPVRETNLQDTDIRELNNYGRVLKVSISFPGPDGRVNGFNL